GIISRSLINQIKRRPGVGWVRADLVLSEASALEILNLEREVEALRAELGKSRFLPPSGTESQTQGAAETLLTFHLHLHAPRGNETGYYEAVVKLSWNEIFSLIGPMMLRWQSEYDLHHAFANFFKQQVCESMFPDSAGRVVEPTILREIDFQKFIIQLRA